jgi:hypothetical protein
MKHVSMRVLNVLSKASTESKRDVAVEDIATVDVVHKLLP